MRMRLMKLVGVAALVVAAAAFFMLVPMTGAGQEGAATTDVPRTPWGEPDLQGIWTNEYDTPLQRPAQLCQQGVFHRAGTGRARQAAGRPARSRPARRARKRARRGRRLQRRVHVNEADRPAHVADRGSPGRESSVHHAGGRRGEPPPTANSGSRSCGPRKRARDNRMPAPAGSTIPRPRPVAPRRSRATTPAG